MRFDFEWEPRKAARNRTKHGVSFAEAATAFFDPLARIVDDPRHSLDEERLVLFGHTRTGRLVGVMFVERGQTRIRIISARPLTRRERLEYEEEIR